MPKRYENYLKKHKKLQVFEIQNLLDVLDNETIAVKTGLDIEEIKKLRSRNS